MLNKRRRCLDITEEKSNDIFDLLNDDFPVLYAVFQFGAFLKKHQNPTTPDIYELYKNSPGELIMRFYNYFNININKYINGKVNIFIDAKYISLLESTQQFINPVLNNDKEAFILIYPSLFGNNPLKIPDNKLYTEGYDDMFEFRDILIKILEKTCNIFINEMHQKYNINMKIDVNQDDFICIYFDFN